ncbi:hypothetical protein BDV98DRAFT_607367 [Pterulicium gracile]|uniref:SnoaL-like domain-containing protein n=1 Tax=Pterulicium gracile TaxID=1884261 RepID=A0A5C3QBX5_9AGAR|nr:hypothetical protein BDV98DRAFT_607367 [Pterula gracilis]
MASSQSGYTQTQWLVDRANIEDALVQLCWSLDRKDWDMERAILNPKGVSFDDSDLFGPDAAGRVMPIEEHIQSDMNFTSYMDVTQNSLSLMRHNLPQPGPNVKLPMQAATEVNVTTTIINKKAKEGDRAVYGAYYTIVVDRVETKDEYANPWKITSLVTSKLWLDGNFKAMLPPDAQ